VNEVQDLYTAPSALRGERALRVRPRRGCLTYRGAALSTASRDTLERWIAREQALLPAGERDAEFAWLEDVLAAVRRVVIRTVRPPRGLDTRVREQLDCSRELLDRLGRLRDTALRLRRRRAELIHAGPRVAGAA
jgi:hypothetical protein